MTSFQVKMLVIAGLILGFFAVFTGKRDQHIAATSQAPKLASTEENQAFSNLQPKPNTQQLTDPPPNDFGSGLADELVKLFQTGQYEEALEYAKRYVHDPAISPELRNWLNRQIPNILTTLGWQKYQQAEYFEAITLFEKALHYRNEPLAIKGLAGSYFQLKYLWQAEHYSRLFLQHNANDFDTTILLLEVLESTQNLADAAEIVNQLNQSEQLNEEQKAYAEKKKKTIRARLIESQHQTTISTSHFILTYRPDEHDGVVNWLLDLLETTLDEFRMDWGFEEPKAPVEIILYPAHSFSQMIHGPEWAQAIYDGRIRIPIDLENQTELSQLERIVRHELAHALTAQQSGHRPLPPWFTEGIAQYLECPQGCRENHSSWASGKFLNEDFFLQSFLDLPKEQARRAYIQSLFMVQTLVEMKGKQAIAKTLEGLSLHGQSDSNQILSPLNLKFPNLYSNALAAWQKTKL